MKIIKTTLILSALLFLTCGIATAQPFTITNVNAIVLNNITGQEDPNMLPRAEPNDQRIPVGRMADGELRIELEALEATWYPRGPDGPRIVTPAFAEVGTPPQVPGPLIQTSAGTPVHVTIRNTLERPIAVRGLLDRASMESESAMPGAGRLPAFAFSEPVVIPPGEIGEARFTPTAEVSSFYYGQVLPEGAGAEAARPFSRLEEGAFMGALVVDDATAAPQETGQVMMITRWGSLAEPGTEISFKFMVNGQSWPFTELLEYMVGDTVAWRVINASATVHPMHLHGFYFTVNAEGDTHTDTAYASGARPLVVTHLMESFSSLRLTWVPEESGNWLFHCHLIRHMGELQRFAVEREGHADDPAGSSHSVHDMDSHHMDTMAGLVTSITVHPGPDAEPAEPSPERRIDLWTSERPNVYDGHPELSFVVQEGNEPPALDSTVVPGSPLILTRGEPTEIIVHNRFGFPISVHWHGLELRSLYDGVGGWSGHPGATRPPIAPGDSARVLITPRRAGTFMYHIHGEAEHELSQGLYGPFLVLEPGDSRNPETDRVFLLAARGAERDAAPAINGRVWPDPERFEPGRTYRLRFLHISPDALKRVRLLRDGEPVRWRTVAKDGADLPELVREVRPAELGIGVGETYDVEWSPDSPGVYVLEVNTEFYPSIGGHATQRVAFGVGELADADLVLPPEAGLSVVTLSAEERARYVGTYITGVPGSGAEPRELVIRVWEEREALYSSLDIGETPGNRFLFFPLGDQTFMPGRDLNGLIHRSEARVRFVLKDSEKDRLEMTFGGGPVLTFMRAGVEP